MYKAEELLVSSVAKTRLPIAIFRARNETPPAHPLLAPRDNRKAAKEYFAARLELEFSVGFTLHADTT
jgi:hypothetical protein